MKIVNLAEKAPLRAKDDKVALSYASLIRCLCAPVLCIALTQALCRFCMSGLLQPIFRATPLIWGPYLFLTVLTVAMTFGDLDNKECKLAFLIGTVLSLYSILYFPGSIKWLGTPESPGFSSSFVWTPTLVSAVFALLLSLKDSQPKRWTTSVSLLLTVVAVVFTVVDSVRDLGIVPHRQYLQHVPAILSGLPMILATLWEKLHAE